MDKLNLDDRAQEMLEAVKMEEKKEQETAASVASLTKVVLMASGYDLQRKHPKLQQIYKEYGSDYDEVVHIPSLDRWFARNFHEIREFVFHANGAIQSVFIGEGDKRRKCFVVAETSGRVSSSKGSIVPIPDTWEKHGCYDGCWEWIEILFDREITEKQVNDLILSKDK